MHPLLRFLLAVVAGLAVGSLVNGSLIAVGPQWVPPPPGTDTRTLEGLKAALPLFEARHFLVPFLAHALGTLAGALVATLAAPAGASRPAWIVGGFFLLGGLANVLMLGGPLWFTALDLLVAYLPMAWLGLQAGRRLRPTPG